ncbi:hypothetical protein J2Y46_003172 [Microbacterium sp. BE35]|nr:hypothetical protein [Microbacterium sp. BE35]
MSADDVDEFTRLLALFCVMRHPSLVAITTWS